MPKIINGETCYTVTESRARTHEYIRKSAEKIPEELKALTSKH